MGPSFDPNDGDFFDAKWKQARDSVKYKLGHLKNVLLGCLMINSPNIIELIQRTNNRVYKASQSLDTSLQNSPYTGSDFAGKYEDYMEDRASRFNQVPGLVIRMIQSIQNDLQAASNLMDVNAQERGSLALLLESYKSQYTIGNSAGKWQYQINSEWDTNNVKRDLDNAGLLDFRNLIRQRGDGDSCPLTAPASASLPAATGFETAGGSVRGGGGGGDRPRVHRNSRPLVNRPSCRLLDHPPKPARSTSSSSAPTSCQDDDDCKDYKCSSGDPFCAIAISKSRKLRKRQDPNGSFPTWSRACKNQDPTTTKKEGPSPMMDAQPEGCTSGLYNNLDKCEDSCRMGLCQENAGQPQITCSCN
ncbi:MAG: hypothetical protein Q9228_003930 [Teloschistes exilis]